MSFNNGDMLHASMHAGTHHTVKLKAPSLNYSMPPLLRFVRWLLMLVCVFLYFIFSLF